MPLAPPSFPPRMTRYPRSTLDEASAPARRRVAAADSSSAPYERREPGSAVLLARSPYPNRIVPNECFTRSRNHHEHDRECSRDESSAKTDRLICVIEICALKAIQEQEHAKRLRSSKGLRLASPRSRGLRLKWVPCSVSS